MLPLPNLKITGIDVSIRTRHRCRVMHIQDSRALPFLCFNPHPASLPGDATISAFSGSLQSVSIRTRHRCRVMHVCRMRSGGRLEFQSAPGIAAG